MELTSYTETINGVSFTMKAIQGGTFEMDSNDRYSEEPVHMVTLTDFYMSETEVTQAQYKAIMEKNPSYFKNCDQCPVENVSWNDAQAFIQKLNALTGQQYRLPTEVEWEYCAKGGENYEYAGSNKLDEVGWYWGNSDSKTHPVATKRSNRLGLYDMSGNVWEWCEDWYDSAQKYRVLRGGSWGDSAGNCRVASRVNVTPDYRNIYLGFRILRGASRI